MPNSDYLYAIADKYSDCANLISGKIDLDCLIDKNIFQWHNFIVYLIIFSYLTLLLYPIYQRIILSKFIRKLNRPYNLDLEFPKEHTAHFLLFTTIIVIGILQFKFKILQIACVMIIDFILSFSMIKLEKYNDKIKQNLSKDLNSQKSEK